jgi:hypothetical protein
LLGRSRAGGGAALAAAVGAELVGAGGELVEPVRDPRVVGLKVGPGLGERGQESGRVAVTERVQEALDSRGGAGGEVVQGADLPGQAAQVARVVARPDGDGTVGGALVAGGLNALLAGAAPCGAGDGVGAQAQVAPFGLGRLSSGGACRAVRAAASIMPNAAAAARNEAGPATRPGASCASMWSIFR